MLPSLRNTISAHKILFERTNTGIILFGDEMQKNFQPLFDALPDMKIQKVSSLHELFDSNEVPHYEALEIPDERLHEPMFLVHTSGSSGTLTLRSLSFFHRTSQDYRGLIWILNRQSETDRTKRCVLADSLFVSGYPSGRWRHSQR